MKLSKKNLENCFVILLLSLFTMTSCSKSDEENIENPTPETPVLETPDLTKLPFGGTAPYKILNRKNGDASSNFLSLWLCGLPADGAGANNAKDWTNADGTWDYTKKPQVEGNVIWDSKFEITIDENNNRILTGNGLPNHPTGIFPIAKGTIPWNYDKNPNIISPQPLSFTIPALPQVASAKSCVGFGPAGYSLTGSAIYHGASTLGNDAAAHEMLDRFGGHTDGTQRYHYHYPTKDLQDHIQFQTQGHSPLMGYMLDGFGIYGPYGENGELLKSTDLDDCHGHTHSVLWDGKMINLFHYHWTYDFPYNIGAYKGTPRK